MKLWVSNASRSSTGTRLRRERMLWMVNTNKLLQMMKTNISIGVTLFPIRLFLAPIYFQLSIQGKLRMFKGLGERSVWPSFNWFATSLKMIIVTVPSICFCGLTKGVWWISLPSTIGYIRYLQLSSRHQMSKMLVILVLQISGQIYQQFLSKIWDSITHTPPRGYTLTP